MPKKNKSISVPEFAAAFTQFMQDMRENTPPKEEAKLARRLHDHFQTEPGKLPIVEEKYEKSDHPNLHLAIEAYLAQNGVQHELIGVTAPGYYNLDFAGLISPNADDRIHEGPVQYLNIRLGTSSEDHVLACVNSGIYLMHHGKQPLALFLQGPGDHWGSQLTVEVMAKERKPAEDLLTQFRAHMRKNSVYRGRVISLGRDGMGNMAVEFHQLPQIKRDGIILPSEVLARIERHTITFAKLSVKLLEAQRHLKRGILLWGPPGTGKTLTAMYLASQMPDRTVIILTGNGMAFTERSIELARALQPATVILEDVDLIGEERTREGSCTALLFELLNQMDGLSEDADVMFILTTNRPDILEPALAARPGRVDQAIEIPLPDAENRRRLIEKYSEGMHTRLKRIDRLIDKTEGVSAAFIKELMRKSLLFAAEASSDHKKVVVSDAHVEDALYDLMTAGGELTRRLLGAHQS
jgi:hypothetical protein